MEGRSNIRSIYVYADWAGMKEAVCMGELKAEFTRGREIFSFTYADDWLMTDYSQILDPELHFYSGSQYVSDEEKNFGVFLDSSPDRWGRLLMKRREAAEAKAEGRSAITLRESDYLLGVFDGHRMGAFRFKENPDGPFLNDNREFSSPKRMMLRNILNIYNGSGCLLIPGPHLEGQDQRQAFLMLTVIYGLQSFQVNPIKKISVDGKWSPMILPEMPVLMSRPQRFRNSRVSTIPS